MDLTDRQNGVMVALSAVDRPATADTVAAAMKCVVPPDSRGVAQTFRSLRRLELVDRTEDGGYKFTRKGAAKARKLAA